MSNESSRSFPLGTVAFAALLMLLGGEVARAGEAPPQAVAQASLQKPKPAEPPAQGVSVRSLVATAEAELAAGRPGPAIVQYERARLLAPRAPTVMAGLARARSVAGLPPTDASVASRIVGRLDANEWGWIGMAGLVLAAAGLIAFSWGFIRRLGSLILALGGVGMASVGLLSAAQVTPPPDRAVVVAPDTLARIAPFAGAEPTFLAPEGAIVTVERTHDNYALIAAPEGRGWVPKGGVEIILPANGKHS